MRLMAKADEADASVATTSSRSWGQHTASGAKPSATAVALGAGRCLFDTRSVKLSRQSIPQ